MAGGEGGEHLRQIFKILAAGIFAVLNPAYAILCAFALTIICLKCVITGKDDNLPEIVWKSGSMVLMNAWNKSNGLRILVYGILSYPLGVIGLTVIALVVSGVFFRIRMIKLKRN